MKLPIFTTNRLILTEVTEEDIPSYEKYFVNYEVIKHLSSAVPWPYPNEGVEWFINTQVVPRQGIDKWVWGIHLKTNPNELIGAVDLWREGKPENRGFWLGEPFWNQGIMTEAVAPITEYAFAQLNFDTLIFSNAKGNIQSRRIKEKTGAKYIRSEPASFVDPVYLENEIWEFTKQDWQKVCKSKNNRGHP
ncbi:GNAT family N-acetyltransferase [Marinagarivorans cellulosilyticus]|uniref:N-acetyltransferase domain-containing protein n=1 Tax=Marinagarivorans cellulosilyticus TaxID=2721545 RepID=A0AAN1WE19_9GAMM|nr:GNAT family N-acetyltransferase [Marinagarivorans cellulosilyticus]BCD95876.1 hypothetical protein MARGE09_P0075 [Marinagarivorans cellulosilyticus]